MIFQNFGFNQKYAVAAAPAAVLFPDQSLATFTATEATQWQTAASAFNTTTYGYASSVSDLGSVAGGAAKYNYSALASNGKIYAPGHVNSNWLIVDTFNDTFTTSTGTFNGDNDGCVFDKITGFVYAFGNGGCKINPSTDVSATISGPGNRQAPGVQSFDGNKLYTAGAFGTSGIYEYNVSANTNTYKQSQGSAAGDQGTLAFNGKIYFSSGGGSSFLEYDPATNTATNFGSIATDKYFLMITHPDGYVYALGNVGVIKKIDPATRTITDITATGYVAFAGCLGMDGKIYTVASNEGQIRYFDPATNTIGTISSGFADSSYQGIAMGAKGDLYVTPWSGAHVYKLALTTGTATAPAICQEYNFGGRFCWPG